MRILRIMLETRFAPAFGFLDNLGIHATKFQDAAEEGALLEIAPNKVEIKNSTEEKSLMVSMFVERIAASFEEQSLEIEKYANILKIMDDYYKLYNIDKFSFIGVRFVFLSKEIPFDNVLTKMTKDIKITNDNNIKNAKIHDICLITEYKKGKYNIRVQCGPMNKKSKKDVKVYLPGVIPKDIETWFHIDCDVTLQNYDKTDFNSLKQIESSKKQALVFVNNYMSYYGE